MNSPDVVETWASAMVDALRDLSTSTWGSELIEAEVPLSKFPKGAPGSYIALVGESYNYEFGVSSTWEDCTTLSKKLLFMEDDEEIAEVEVADAMNEIANMVGGGVKRRMADFDPGLKLGLPAFFEGPICPTSAQESAYAQVEIEGLRVYLVALKHKSATKS